MLAHDGNEPTTMAHPPSLVAGSARDPVTACACDVDTEIGPAGSILVLRVAGEIDMLTQRLVRTALAAALDHTPQDLVVDLAGVGFCCVRGFELLADAAHTCRAAGIGFSLSGLSAHLDRITTMLWPEQQFPRYRSAAAAVTALRVERTHRTT